MAVWRRYWGDTRHCLDRDTTRQPNPRLPRLRPSPRKVCSGPIRGEHGDHVTSLHQPQLTCSVTASCSRAGDSEAVLLAAHVSPHTIGAWTQIEI